MITACLRIACHFPSVSGAFYLLHLSSTCTNQTFFPTYLPISCTSPPHTTTAPFASLLSLLSTASLSTLFRPPYLPVSIFLNPLSFVHRTLLFRCSPTARFPSGKRSVFSPCSALWIRLCNSLASWVQSPPDRPALASLSLASHPAFFVSRKTWIIKTLPCETNEKEKTIDERLSLRVFQLLSLSISRPSER